MLKTTDDHRDRVRIRPARVEDAERLREITALSKGHWGYDPVLIKQWADAYDFPVKLREQELFVAEITEEIVAWASLIPPANGVAVLNDLWVEPDWIGEGIGSLLFSAARERAARLGAHLMEWQSEPNASGFYERMGGRYLRDEISEWGRKIEVMGVSVAER